MSFTSSSLIKAHLLSATFPELVIENQPVTLPGTDAIKLPHHNLVAGTDSVKWDANTGLTLDSPVTLTDYDDAFLAHNPLVRGSVLVTLGEALTTVYVEERDYQVDYARGTVHRVPGGTIPNGQSVLIYYLYYTAFVLNTDYDIDYADGLLTRNGGGSIPDGATVLVDYTVTSGTVEDDLLAQAITEAEDLILRSLSPEYNSGSTDQGLQTGATQLALSIICRAQGIEALSRRATTDVPGRAKEWQQLSRFYEQEAWETLAPFLLPLSVRSTYRQTRETN